LSKKSRTPCKRPHSFHKNQRNKGKGKAFSWNRLLRHKATYHYHSKVYPKLKLSLKLAQLTALLVSLSCTILAQQKSQATLAPFNPAAYRVGERLTYNVGFSHFISAGHVELFVAAYGPFFNREGIQLRAHVETAGVVNAALLSLNNDYTTYVDPQTGLPYRAQQVVREAGRTSEASRDYNQPAGTDAIPSRLRTGESPGTYDLLSALYRMRAMPLADGDSYFITVVNEGDLYPAEVRVIGRQLIKTNVGSFNTIVTRVNVKYSHDYSIRVYFSDDERHVPVLITAKHPSGEIRAELAGSELAVPAPGPQTIGTPQPIRTGPQESLGNVNKTIPGSGQSLTSGNTTSTPMADVPFKIGEQLSYQVYLVGTTQPVGTVTFTLKARGRYFERDGLLFSVTAQTTGAGGRVFPVRDQINSYVDPATLLPFRTELDLTEGKYRSNRGYNLDQNHGSAVADSKERIVIPVGTHDLISAFYAIRTFELWPKKRNAISIMATTQPRTLFVESLRREAIELGGQKLSTIMVTLTTDDPQGDRMQIRMWIGDDTRHLPLRIAAVTQLGAVHADLSIQPTNSR
jgi:hypothetical protein